VFEAVNSYRKKFGDDRSQSPQHDILVREIPVETQLGIVDIVRRAGPGSVRWRSDTRLTGPRIEIAKEYLEFQKHLRPIDICG
jgi:hypothetical protein